nr:ISL3 family transposase [Methylobacterium organophilum]
MLNLPGVVETDQEEADDHYVVHARSSRPTAKACSLACKLRKNGTKPLDINDVPHHGKATLIRFRRQQFSCPDCLNEVGEKVGNDAISERLAFTEPGFLMTRRLVLWMARQAMRRTFAEIGRDAYVDPKSVAKAFDAYTSVEIAKLKRETPRVLGIDEKRLRGEFRAVMGNLEALTVLDMLKDRGETLELHLNRLSEDRRLEVVVTDRFDGYRKMIRRRLPGRLHVTDRFHVTRAANEVLDQIRAAVAKRLPDRREGAALRMSRQLFRTRWSQTTDEQKATITDWCQRHPIISDAYWTKERYCDLYLCASPAEAEAYYKDWLATLPPSVALAYKTKCAIPRRWMPMVLAYFEEPYTTGYVESVNRFLDDLQRDGRGYSFEVIRAKLMLAEKLERRTFRGRNSVTRIPVLPHADELIDGGEMYVAVESADDLLSIPRFGIDLEKVHALVTRPPQTIMWKGEERTLASELSTVWPRFMISPGQTRSTVFSR